MTIIRMHRVSKHRGHGSHSVNVLHGVSLEVARGEIVLLQGPSGSGKTTLLGLAAGLLLADEGVVEINGNCLSTMTPELRRGLRAKKIGFVFQRSNLFAELTVRENVCLMGTLAGMTNNAAMSEADSLLAKLGMSSHANQFPFELSGGQEQRVAVARALVHSPLLVLADEPTGNLDRASGRAVADALIEIARSKNSAVIVATHDARLRPIASRHLTVVDGKVEEADAASNEIFA